MIRRVALISACNVCAVTGSLESLLVSAKKWLVPVRDSPTLARRSMSRGSIQESIRKLRRQETWLQRFRPCCGHFVEQLGKPNFYILKIQHQCQWVTHRSCDSSFGRFLKHAQEYLRQMLLQECSAYSPPVNLTDTKWGKNFERTHLVQISAKSSNSSLLREFRQTFLGYTFSTR